MSRRSRSGFTLIELMIALVVAGLMMASLLALSGSVQRSFGRSKDISDLQANLRFAMKFMADDFARAAYMYNADPYEEGSVPAGCQKLYGVFPDPDKRSIHWDDDNQRFELRGNFLSARDYLYDLDKDNEGRRRIVCRNERDPLQDAKCGIKHLDFDDPESYEEYLKPYADGEKAENLFCAGQLVRLDAGDRHYMYLTVSSVSGTTADNDFGLELQTLGNVDLQAKRDRIPGRYKWINPITTVFYEVATDAAYVSPYGGANQTASAGRHFLKRTSDDCRGRRETEVAEFLLPRGAADAPDGWEIEVIWDSNAGAAYCANGAWTPVIEGPETLADAGVAALWPLRLRALVFTLRGRTETEDPQFVMPGYLPGDPDDPAKNFGIDLDGTPENGLARVRVERTVIDVRNVAANLNTL